MNDEHDYIELITGLDARYEALAWGCILKGTGDHDLSRDPEAQKLGVSGCRVKVFIPWQTRHNLDEGKDETCGFIDVWFARSGTKTCSFESCGYSCHYEFKLQITGCGGVPTALGQAILEVDAVGREGQQP